MEFICDNCDFEGTNIQVRLYKIKDPIYDLDIHAYVCNNCHPTYLNELLSSFYKNSNLIEMEYSEKCLLNDVDLLNSETQKANDRYMNSFLRYQRNLLKMRAIQHEFEESCKYLNRDLIYSEKLMSLSSSNDESEEKSKKPKVSPSNGWIQEVNDQLRDIEKNSSSILCNQDIKIIDDDDDDNGEMIVQ